MRVAIIHDHLAQDGGAERVVRVLQQMWPKAPVFTLLYDPRHAHPDFRQTKIHTSFIQNLPGGNRFYQWYLPLMPTAVESYDLNEYDLVVSSSASFAKGVITLPQTLHVSYIHSPTRYLWSDTHRYVDELHYPRFLRSLAPMFLTRIRMWDSLAAQGPDVMIANSHLVQQRIAKYYHRDSTIIPPPVNAERFTAAAGQGGYYLASGRLVTYKRFDGAIKAFNRLGLSLKIYGTGPAYKELRDMAKENIEFLGKVPDTDLPDLYGQAIAFINPQEEDFGITAVEAMAAGRPVIAYAAGGAIETVKPGVSGVLFEDQGWESLADAVIRFKPETYSPTAIKAWAETFSVAQFKSTMQKFIEQARITHQQRMNISK